MWTTILKCGKCGKKIEISGKYSGKGYICPACVVQPSQNDSMRSSTNSTTLGGTISTPTYQETPDDPGGVDDELRRMIRRKGMFR